MTASAGVVTRLSIFASTPDMDEHAFTVKVLTGTLDAIALQAVKWGFDGIELLPNPDHVPRAEAVERAVSAAGACVTAINSGRLYAQGMALLHRDPGARRHALKMFKRLIDLGAGLGVPIGLGGARGATELTVSPADEERVALGVFEEIAVYAEKVGGLVMLEPADSAETPSVPTVAEAVAWVERVGSPALAIMLDTHQIATREQSFEQALAAAKGIARHIHLYDRGRRPPGTAGPNALDWAAVSRALAASGFTGTGSVVLASEGNVAERAHTAARFLRTVLME